MANGESDPERQTMAYQWPASQITRADMIRLSELRGTVRRPITKLLHEAVKAYYDLLVGGSGDEEAREGLEYCCEQPRLEWRGTREIAAIVCKSCGFVLADDGQLGDWHDPEQIAWEAELKAEEAAMAEASGSDGLPESGR